MRSDPRLWTSWAPPSADRGSCPEAGPIQGPSPPAGAAPADSCTYERDPHVGVDRAGKRGAGTTAWPDRWPRPTRAAARRRTATIALSLPGDHPQTPPSPGGPGPHMSAPRPGEGTSACRGPRYGPETPPGAPVAHWRRASKSRRRPWYAGVRIGEASHPGPPTTAPAAPPGPSTEQAEQPMEGGSMATLLLRGLCNEIERLRAVGPMPANYTWSAVLVPALWLAALPGVEHLPIWTLRGSLWSAVCQLRQTSVRQESATNMLFRSTSSG